MLPKVDKIYCIVRSSYSQYTAIARLDTGIIIMLDICSDNNVAIVVKELLGKELKAKEYSIIKDTGNIMHRFLDVDLDEIITIETNMSGVILTTDNKSFLARCNDLPFEDGSYIYNTGSMQVPELETFSVDIESKPIVSIVGNISTFNIYQFHPKWELVYSNI